MNLIKTSLLTLLVAVSVFMISCNNTAQTEIVEVEPTAVTGDFSVTTENSELVWTGSKVTGKHFGNISISDGSVLLEDGNLVAGKFTVDMTSLSVTDIEDEETNGQLKGHLLSADFFDVENYNDATLSVRGSEGNVVNGDLTIKGITNPVSFPVTLVENEDGTAVLSGTLTVDRTLYEIKYGSASFFDNLADKAISNEFTLDFTIKL